METGYASLGCSRAGRRNIRRVRCRSAACSICLSRGQAARKSKGQGKARGKEKQGARELYLIPLPFIHLFLQGYYCE
jgi:hypothetical protein